MEIDRVIVSYIAQNNIYVISPIANGIRQRALQETSATEPKSSDILRKYGNHIVIERLTLGKTHERV